MRGRWPGLGSRQGQLVGEWGAVSVRGGAPKKVSSVANTLGRARVRVRVRVR